MNAVKIIHSHSVSLITLNVFFYYKPTITTIVVSRNILSILETNMI